MTTNCRLLPYGIADGPHNMAADEVLLETAVEGTSSLRFYGWSAPTISLGYFQPSALRADSPLATLPFVRRASGGMTLVHHHEVTYALALPSRLLRPGESWICRMHHTIRAALAELGVTAQTHSSPDHHSSGPLCFQHFTAGDLLIDSVKVVGSAQRKLRGALLQHGGILLAQSPCAPSLPGIRELTGHDLKSEAICAAVQRAFERDTGWTLKPAGWTEDERRRVEELVHARYGRTEWNEKR
jgi:lipoate-protein ligase A